MKNILLSKVRLLFAVGCSFALLATSCGINEDLDACPPERAEGSYALVLKALYDRVDDNDNPYTEDVTGTGEELLDASVYIFDKNNEYITSHKLSTADIMARKLMEVPKTTAGDKIKVVAWGNVAGNNQILSEGEVIDEIKVQLKSQDSEATHPDELFHGLDDFTVRIQADEVIVDTVVVEVIVASMTAETIGLGNALVLRGFRADEVELFTFKVDNTASVFDYEGNLSGDSVHYNPEGATHSVRPTDWEVADPKFTVQGEALSVMPILAGIPLLDVPEILDPDGNSWDFDPKQNTHFIIEFGPEGEITSIRAEVRPWGYKKKHIDWQ